MSTRTPYTEGTLVHETDCDPSDATAVVSAVVEAVAAVEETPPTELAPLYDSVDLEAVAAFVCHAAASGQRESAVVTFSVEDLVVAVHADGRVAVREVGNEAVAFGDAAERQSSAADCL